MNQDLSPAARDQILTLEAERYAAMLVPDIARLNELIADDVVYIHTNALIESKAVFVGSLAEGRRRYVKIAPVNQVVRGWGDMFIVTGETDIAYVTRGQTFDVRIASTSVWRRDGAALRLVSWHSSRG